jgi:hypothetical protein
VVPTATKTRNCSVSLSPEVKWSVPPLLGEGGWKSTQTEQHIAKGEVMRIKTINLMFPAFLALALWLGLTDRVSWWVILLIFTYGWEVNYRLHD